MTIIGNGDRQMTYRFWMVYGEGQRAPTYKHDSRASAEAEALRLARQHPGIAFYALCAVSAAGSPPPPQAVVTVLAPAPTPPDDDDLPF